MKPYKSEHSARRVRSWTSVLVLVALLASCSSSSDSVGSDFGAAPSELAFASAPQALTSALVADTLVADSEGARCASQRIAAQLDPSQLKRVSDTGSLGTLNLDRSEAVALVDALFDCTDPRDGIAVGLESDGLDAGTAACIAFQIDSATLRTAMVQSFSGATAAELSPLAIEFTQATNTCR